MEEKEREEAAKIFKVECMEIKLEEDLCQTEKESTVQLKVIQ